MTESVDTAVRQAVAAPRRATARSWSWVGVVPFFIFALLFLILPTVNLLVGSFQKHITDLRKQLSFIAKRNSPARNETPVTKLFCRGKITKPPVSFH